ncbi:sugar phosphate isomerase/epimerase family protein [Halobellus sp. EA9]|uniref:sugar phosphate isomerase/epimerase family protein n=1 Tax=Halobellus sp. EA9 TaxID=3421647 RepID=UPI003EB75CAD
MTERFGASMDLRFDCSFEEFVAFLDERDLSHVELRQGYLDTYPDAPAPEHVRDVSEEYDVTVSYHAPHRDCNLASANETLRAGAVEAVKQSIRTAETAGANAVVVHGGTFRSHYPERVRDANRDAAVRSLRECARLADDVGIPLCVENQRDKDQKKRFTARPERFAALLDDVAAGAPRPSVTLDVGHAKATGVSLADLLDAVGDDVVVAHLHDNDGTTDSHDPLPDFRTIAADLDAAYNVLEMKSLADIDHCLAVPEDRL